MVCGLFLSSKICSNKECSPSLREIDELDDICWLHVDEDLPDGSALQPTPQVPQRVNQSTNRQTFKQYMIYFIYLKYWVSYNPYSIKWYIIMKRKYLLNLFIYNWFSGKNYGTVYKMLRQKERYNWGLKGIIKVYWPMTPFSGPSQRSWPSLFTLYSQEPMSSKIS